MVVIRLNTTSSSTPAVEAAVMRARAPCRSSHRPTGTARAAPVRTLAVNAPVTAVVEACRSTASGVRRTAKA